MARLSWDALIIAQGKQPVVWKEGETQEKLMQIRRGEWSREHLERMVTTTLKLIEAMKPWLLPAEGDTAFLNDWLLRIRVKDLEARS